MSTPQRSREAEFAALRTQRRADSLAKQAAVDKRILTRDGCAASIAEACSVSQNMVRDRARALGVTLPTFQEWY